MEEIADLVLKHEQLFSFLSHAAEDVENAPETQGTHAHAFRCLQEKRFFFGCIYLLLSFFFFPIVHTVSLVEESETERESKRKRAVARAKVRKNAFAAVALGGGR